MNVGDIVNLNNNWNHLYPDTYLVTGLYDGGDSNYDDKPTKKYYKKRTKAK